MPGTKWAINHYRSDSSPACFLVQGIGGGSWLLILIAGGEQRIHHGRDLGVGRVGAMGGMEQVCEEPRVWPKNEVRQRKSGAVRSSGLSLKWKWLSRLWDALSMKQKGLQLFLAFIFLANEEVENMVLGWRGALGFSTAARSEPVTVFYSTSEKPSETTVNWPVPVSPHLQGKAGPSLFPFQIPKGLTLRKHFPPIGNRLGRN